jgi:hypothetical protein
MSAHESSAQQAEEVSVTQLPEGSKLVLAPEKVTPKVKKERTEAQKLAFEKMRAKRLENDQKRRLSKAESQEVEDEVKVQHEQDEEEQRLKMAEELKQKYGVHVVVQKKRGRKPGQHIPYKKPVSQSGQPDRREEEKVTVVQPPTVVEPAVQRPQAPLRSAPTGAPQYTNPYMSMLLNKMKR